MSLHYNSHSVHRFQYRKTVQHQSILRKTHHILFDNPLMNLILMILLQKKSPVSIQIMKCAQLIHSLKYKTPCL